MKKLSKFIGLACIALLGTCSTVQAQSTVRIGRHSFVPEPNVVSTRSGSRVQMQENQFVNNKAAVLMQFRSMPTAAQRKQLERAGVSLTNYLGGNAFYATMAKGFNPSGVDGLRSLMPLKGEWKYDLLLERWDIPVHARVGSNGARVLLRHFGNVTTQWVAQTLAAKGYTDVEVFPRLGLVSLVLTRERLHELAAEGWVARLQLAPRPEELLNVSGATLGRANVLRQSGLLGGRGLTGRGVKVGVWDGNVQRHFDYGNRLHQQEFEIGVDESGGHGMHVSGTVGGAGLLDPNAMGMAPEVDLYTYNFNTHSNGLSPQEEMWDAREMFGISLTQNSYGLYLSYYCDYYEEFSYSAQASSFNLDLLVNYMPELTHVFAAGNDQGDCGRSYGTSLHRAKNVIYVGAVDELGQPSSFSSWGPMDDGRVMPTVSAKGVDVYSTMPGNDYGLMDGTSMATPTVTGQLALLTERYMQLNRSEPIAALVRGVAANTATDMNHPGPCYVYGYGVLNSEAAVQAIENKQYRVASIAQGDAAHTYNIDVPAGVRRLKVALAWSDTISVKEYAYGEPALVNDIDLEVVANGQTYLPWVLDKDNPSAAPTRQRDHINNLEQVTIDNPRAGSVTMRVLSGSVPSAQQQYAITWWFETDALLLTYPIGGELMEPGQRFVLRCQNVGKAYTAEVSYDGGNSYVLLGQFSGSEQPMAIPADAPSTDKALLRIIDQQGNIAQTMQPFSIMAQPKGLTLSEANGSAVLNWEAVPTAASYEVLRIVPDGTVEVVATTTATSFRLLVEHLVADVRNAFSVRAVAANGVRGQRAVAQEVNSTSGMPMNISIPFIEEFVITPSPYLHEEHGSNMTVYYTESPAGFGTVGSHVLISAASETANSHGFGVEKSNSLIGFAPLDLTNVTGSVFMSVYGVLYDGGQPDNNLLCLEVDGQRLPLVDGRNHVRGLGEESSWIWDLSAYVGQRVNVMLRHASANTSSVLLIANIELLGEHPEPDASVYNVSMASTVGQFGTEETVEVMVKNNSTNAIAQLPLTIELDGQLRGGVVLNNLAPLELRTVNVVADLSCSEPLGGQMRLVARLHPEQDVAPQNNADTIRVYHLGQVQPMPRGSIVDILGMAMYVQGKDTRTVTDSLYVSDCEGPWKRYSGTKDDVLKLLPSKADNVLQISFKWIELGRSDKLAVFTGDVSSMLYTNSLHAERTLTAADSEPVVFTSHAADGAITLHHIAPSGSAGGRGWLAIVREIPRVGNMLAVSDLKANVDVANAEVEVTVTVDNVGSVHQHDVRLLLLQGVSRRNGKAEEVIESIAPGQSITHTFAYKPTVAVPSYDSIEVRAFGYDMHAADNAKIVGICADTYAPSPRITNTRSRIAEIEMYGKTIYCTVPDGEYQEFKTRDTLTLYADAVTNDLKVLVYTNMPRTLGLWVDWNNTGSFDGQPTTIAVDDRGQYVFNLTPPAGTAPGAKRVRMMLTDVAELVPYASGLNSIGQGDIKDFIVKVVPGNYPLLNDLAVEDVKSAKPGIGLKSDTVSVTVSNNANLPVRQFTLSMTVDGGEVVSQTFDTLVPAFGGMVTVQMEQLADLSAWGRHEIVVSLPDDENLENNSKSYVTSHVQPLQPQRDHYLHFGLDSLEEALVLSDVGAARTGYHFAFDMWLKLDKPQTAPIISCGDYLLMVLHGEQGLPDNALLVVYANGGQQLFATMPNTIMPGRWYHVAVSNLVFGPSEAKIFINGEQQTLLQGSGEAYSTFFNMRVFRAVSGAIDNLRFWDKEFKDTDITKYMYSKARNAEGRLPYGCVAEFDMNEGAGNTAILSDSTHYALITSRRTAAGDNSVWKIYRQLFYNAQLDGQVEAVRNGSQMLVTFPKNADLSQVRCVVDKHFGAKLSYNGQPFDTETVIDLSQGEAVLLARLDMFGFSHRDTLRIVPQHDLSAEASIVSLTLQASKNQGLMADTTISPVSQSLNLELPAAVDAQRVVIDFELASGATLYIDNEAQQSPITVDLRKPQVLTVVAENERDSRIYTIASVAANVVNISNINTQIFYGDTLRGLPQLSSAGLPLTYSTSNNAVLCNTNGHLVATGVGRATLLAMQHGDNAHVAAEPVSIDIEVLPRHATVQPQAVVMEFGSIPQPLQWAFSGLINSDELVLAQPIAYRYVKDGVEYDADNQLLAVGRYTLQTTAQPFVCGNYRLSPVDGQLEVVASNAHAVTFRVADGSATPLADVAIEVNGLQLRTDAQGEATTHLLPGQWLYTAALDGYGAVEQQLEVLNADVQANITLMPIDIRLSYSAASNGSIFGAAEQFVVAHGQGQPVSAMPNDGYRFDAWSDGRTDNPRTDVDVTAPVMVQAQFVRSVPSFTLTYAAGLFGSISGNDVQTVERGESGTEVEAIPEAGAVFNGWSDGLATPKRTDTNVQADARYQANFSKNLDLPYSQNFELSNDMPFAWSVRTESGARWKIGNANTFYAELNWSGNVAVVISDGVSGLTSSTLQSPCFNLQSVTGDIIVEYDWLHRGNYRSKGALMMQIDDGEWVKYRDIDATTNVSDLVHAADTIPAATFENHNTVRFGWYYSVTNWYYMIIDNVSIRATGMSGSVTAIYVAGEGGSVNGNAVEKHTITVGTEGPQISAMPNAGYRFEAWSDGRLDNPRTDTVGAMVTALFVYDPSTFTYHSLAYDVDAPEHAVLHGGILQPKVIQGTDGALVEVMPITQGYRFVNWSDGRTDNPRTDRNVQADVAVTAHLSNVYSVRYSSASPTMGSIEGVGEQQVVYGESTTEVLAQPAQGYHFVGWSDGRTDNPRTDVVLTDMDVTALFDNLYTIAYTATSGGTLRGDTQQHIAANASGTEVVAHPYSGYRFEAWSDGLAEAARTEVNPQGDMSLTALFSPIVYRVAYTAAAGGSISGAAEQQVEYGQNSTEVVAVPAQGYAFAGWSDGRTDNPRIERAVVRSIDVQAQFAGQVTLTYAASAGGSLQGNATQTVACGADGQPVEAIADANHHFVGWSDGRTDNPRTDVAVQTSINVVALFSNLWNVTYIAQPGGYISGNAKQQVAHGADAAEVTAQPIDGYMFTGWSDGRTDNPRTDAAVQADLTITALFAPQMYTLNVTNNLGIAHNYGIPGISHIYATIDNANQILPYGSNSLPVLVKPEPGVKFLRWSDGNTDNPRVFNVTGNMSPKAELEACSVRLYVEYPTEMGRQLSVCEGLFGQPYESGESYDLDLFTFVLVNYTFNPQAVGKSVVIETVGLTPSSFVNPDAPNGHYYHITSPVAYVKVSLVDVTYDHFSLTYAANSGGYVVGEAKQRVEYGYSGTPVLAVPAQGFHFAGWSDGRTDNPRIDALVFDNISVTALFAADTLSQPVADTLFQVAFVVLDTDARPVSGATIAIGQGIYTTDSHGKVQADSLSSGDYVYTAFAPTFEPLVAQFNVQSDTVLHVRLSRLATGIATTEQTEVRCYPNPTSTGFYVETTNPTMVWVYNTAGHLLHQQPASGTTYVDIAHLPAGVYIIRIDSTATRLVKL